MFLVPQKLKCDVDPATRRVVVVTELHALDHFSARIHASSILHLQICLKWYLNALGRRLASGLEIIWSVQECGNTWLRGKINRLDIYDRACSLLGRKGGAGSIVLHPVGLNVLDLHAEPPLHEILISNTLCNVHV